MSLNAFRKNGESFQPNFIVSVNPINCIGCGRCFKVCGQGVFNLVERADLELDSDDYDDDGAMVMTVENDGQCIGCEACSRVCPKACHCFEKAA